MHRSVGAVELQYVLELRFLAQEIGQRLIERDIFRLDEVVFHSVKGVVAGVGDGEQTRHSLAEADHEGADVLRLKQRLARILVAEAKDESEGA